MTLGFIKFLLNELPILLQQQQQRTANYSQVFQYMEGDSST